MQAVLPGCRCAKRAAALALFLAVFCVAIAVHPADANAQTPQQKDDGYRGIWFTLGQVSEYGDKNPGGLGTYTVKH